MSHFWRPAVVDGYEWVIPATTADAELLQALEFETVGQVALNVSFETACPDVSPCAGAEMPWYNHSFLALRENAVAELGALLAPHGMLVSVDCDRGPLCLFVPSVLRGALDENSSEVVRFQSGRIMDIRRPVFDADKVGAVSAFKLEGFPHGPMFLTRDLAHAIKDSGVCDGVQFAAV